MEVRKHTFCLLSPPPSVPCCVDLGPLNLSVPVSSGQIRVNNYVTEPGLWKVPYIHQLSSSS